MNTASATAETLNQGHDGTYRRHRCGPRMGHKKRWAGAEIAAVVGGFIVFWPIGLAALGLKLFRGEMWNGASDGVTPWAAYKDWKAKHPEGFQGFTAPNWAQGTSSGNSAFDAYKKEQLDRLEAERRKLAEEQKAFAEYLTKLRQAKDVDEFNRFMAERNAPKPSEG
jgi:hypothetical protein